MTRPPNSSLTGSQVAVVKKLSPYLSMAGQAPTINEPRMAIKRARVNNAAPLASQAKTRSAKGLEGARLTEAAWVMAGPAYVSVEFKDSSSAESVVDMASASDGQTSPITTYFK